MENVLTDLSKHIRQLFEKKYIVIIGDSVQRSVYKDLILIFQEQRHLKDHELRAKGEESFLGDKLVEGGVKEGLQNGVNYTEVRKFLFPASQVELRFYFVTRCYSDYLKKVLTSLKVNPPDIIVMNSCLWDLHRYGEHGPAAFKRNLKKLMENLVEMLPDTDFIWMATLPVDKGCRAGFLDAGQQQQITVQEIEIVEANFVAQQIVVEYGRMFLNLNKIFVQQLHHRAKDGVHWNGVAHRQITLILLTEMNRLQCHRLMGPFLNPLLPQPVQSQHRRSASMPETSIWKLWPTPQPTPSSHQPTVIQTSTYYRYPNSNKQVQNTPTPLRISLRNRGRPIFNFGVNGEQGYQQHQSIDSRLHPNYLMPQNNNFLSSNALAIRPGKRSYSSFEENDDSYPRRSAKRARVRSHASFTPFRTPAFWACMEQQWSTRPTLQFHGF